MGASPLSRVPRKENGKPDYIAVEPEVAWDAMVEASNGEEAKATNLVNGYIKFAKAALEKAKKAKVADTDDIDAYAEAEAQRQEAIDRAQAALDAWQRIADEPARRAAQAQEQQGAEASSYDDFDSELKVAGIKGSLKSVKDGVAIYEDQKSGETVIILSAHSQQSYCALYRKPGTNRWSTKMENADGKGVWGGVISRAMAQLPDGAEVYERSSVSLDGLRVLAQQFSHGFESSGETYRTDLNSADKAGTFVSQRRKDDPFFSIYWDGDVEELRDILEPYLDALGMGREAVEMRGDGKVRLTLPVLVKTGHKGTAEPMRIDISSQEAAPRPKRSFSLTRGEEEDATVEAEAKRAQQEAEAKAQAEEERQKREESPSSVEESPSSVEESVVREDNQGNPVDENGRFITEKVASVEDITDEDFMNPSRTVELPSLPEVVQDAIGTEGKPVIIKKNVFGKNRDSHKDLTPQQGREILTAALYDPTLYGKNQKQKRPYNWILIHLADKNSSVVIEVNHNKENCEIVNWHYLSGEALERKKRQAIDEGGRILTLSKDNAAANTIDGLSTDKDSSLSVEKQEVKSESSEKAPEQDVEKAQPEVAEVKPVDEETRQEPSGETAPEVTEQKAQEVEAKQEADKVADSEAPVEKAEGEATVKEAEAEAIPSDELGSIMHDALQVSKTADEFINKMAAVVDVSGRQSDLKEIFERYQEGGVDARYLSFYATGYKKADQEKIERAKSVFELAKEANSYEEFVEKMSEAYDVEEGKADCYSIYQGVKNGRITGAELTASKLPMQKVTEVENREAEKPADIRDEKPEQASEGKARARFDRAVPPTTEAQRSAIARIVDFARTVKNRVERAVIGGITTRQMDDLASQGINIDNSWVHSFESSAVKHSQKKHGSSSIESARGQIAITSEDFAKIPDILESYDKVYKSSNTSRRTGNEIIVYEKEFEDGYVYYLEEKRDNRKSLAFQTMYKKKKGTDSSDGLMPNASPSTPIATSDNLSSNSESKGSTSSANGKQEGKKKSQPVRTEQLRPEDVKEREQLRERSLHSEPLPKSTKRKRAPFSLYNFASTDLIYSKSALSGVTHVPEVGCAVSTNKWILIASKNGYNEERAGEAINGKGEIMTNPAYIKEISTLAIKIAKPEDTPVAVAHLDDNVINSALNIPVKTQSEKGVYLDFGDVSVSTDGGVMNAPAMAVVDAYLWKHFLRGAQHIGATEIEYHGQGRPLIARSENGFVMIMSLHNRGDIGRTCYRQDLSGAEGKGNERYSINESEEAGETTDRIDLDADGRLKDTEELLRAKGIEVHYYMGDPQEQGRYENGEVWINLRGNKSAKFVMGHELGHGLDEALKDSPEVLDACNRAAEDYMRAKLGEEGYRKLHEAKKKAYISFLVNKKGLTLEEAQEKVTDGYIDKEMRSDALGDILEDKNAARVFFNGIKDRSLLRKIYDAIAGVINDIMGRMRHGSEKWKAMRNAAKNFAEAYRKADGEIKRNEETRYNLRQYEEKGRKTLQTGLKKLVKKRKISQDLADEISAATEYAYNVCKALSGQFESFDNWSVQEVKIEDSWYTAEGKKRKTPVKQAVFSVIKKNGDYGMNMDFSLLCKKRETLDAVIDALAQEGIFTQTVLKGVDIARITQIIRSRGLESACDICFVDAKRYRIGDVAETFVELWNGLMKLSDDQLRSLEGMTNQQLQDYLYEQGVYAKPSKVEKSRRNKVSDTTEKKVAAYFLQNPEARIERQSGDFLSASSFDRMRIEFPEVLKFYNMRKGVAGPKAGSHNQPYHNEILATKWTPENAYKVGGVRLQSFSDFQGRMVFDYIQLFADLAAKRLPVHAYTKEPLFAKLFGLTGAKINLSLIPSATVDGVAPGLDRNGDYVWAEGQSFPFDEAVKIMNAEGYRDNCGTIAIGVSGPQILKMLDDPMIRMVIPYHTSGVPADVARMHGTYKFKDYTKVQNTRQANGRALTDDQKKDEFSYNEALRKCGDARVAANQYLAWCKEKGYIPKFDEFADHPNYYKLLEDFTTMVPDGKGSEYNAEMSEVRPLYPTSEHAFGDLATLTREALEYDNADVSERNKNVSGIVEQARAEIFTPERLSAKDYDLQVEEATGTPVGGEARFSISEEAESPVASEVRHLAHKAVMECLKRGGIEAEMVTQEEALAKAKEEGVDILETSDGTVYGWVENGKVYLTPEGLNAETPVHEYTHLWASSMEKNAPKVWNQIVKLLKDTPMWETVVNDGLYENIRGNESKIASEVLSRLGGAKGKERFEAEAERIMSEAKGLEEKARVAAMIDRVRLALRNFWRWVSQNMFGQKKFTSVDEVTDRVLYDLTRGTKLDKGEKDRSLVGVHNISLENIRKAMKMGGLANPSVAVIDAGRQEHNGYGEISLIMPSDRLNKGRQGSGGTYAGDAWTPEYPKLFYKQSVQGWKKMKADMSHLPDMVKSLINGSLYQLDNGGLELPAWNIGLKYWFLDQRGMAEKLISALDGGERALEEEANTLLRKGNLFDEYSSWHNDLKRRYGMTEGLYNSATGRWMPHTLENASKIMRSGKKTGIGHIEPERIAAMKRMKTTDEMRKEEDRLVSDRSMLTEFDESNPKGTPGYESAIKEERPAMYFETKFERPVKFDEFAAAVVPNMTPLPVIDFLRSQGMRIEEYDPANKESRREAMQRATQGDGVRFSAAMSSGKAEFDAVREQAIKDKGTVMPGLRDKKVRVIEVPRHNFKGSGKQAIEQARQWAHEKLEGYHVAMKNTLDEFSYLIDEDAIRKYLSKSSTTHSANLGVHLAVLTKLTEIINSSIEAEIHANYRKVSGVRSVENGIESEDILVHRYYGAAMIDGEVYRVKTTLKEFRGNRANQPYNYQVTELELLKSGSTASDALSNSSHITGAKLLEGVEKSYDKGKKLLDESADLSDGETMDAEGTLFRDNLIGSSKRLRDGREIEFTRPNPTNTFNAIQRHLTSMGFNIEERNVARTGSRYLTVSKDGMSVSVRSSNHTNGYGDYLSVGTSQDGARIDSINVDLAEGDMTLPGFKQLMADVEEVNNSGVLEGLAEIYRKDEEQGKKVIDDLNVSPELKEAIRSDVAQHAAILQGKVDRMPETKQQRVEELGEKLGVKIRVIHEGAEMDALNSPRKRKAKGWFDKSTGEVVVVLPNNTDVRDVEKTVLHEVVGHKGLRQLIGEEKFNDFLDSVYAHASKAVKEKIDEIFEKERQRDEQSGNQRTEEETRRVATEEYMSDMAERIGEGGFEKMDAEEKTLWGKIRERVMQLLDSIMKGLGMNSRIKLTNEDIAYILYKSWKNLRNGGKESLADQVADIAMRERTGYDRRADDDVLFRDGETRDRVSARDRYEERMRKGSVQAVEAFQDSMRSLLELYKAIEVAGKGKKARDFRIEDIASYENAYTAENAMSSTTFAQSKKFHRDYMVPVTEAVNALGGKTETGYKDVTRYMMAKHGLERNEYMRNQAIANDQDADRDFAGLTGLTGESDVASAELVAQKIVDDFEQAHKGLVDDLWQAVNTANQAILDKQYEGGLVSEAAYNKASTMYKHYIPLRGWEETTSDEVYNYLTDSYSGRGNVIKTATGRSSVATGYTTRRNNKAVS